MRYVRRLVRPLLVAVVLLATLTPNSTTLSQAPDPNLIAVDGSALVSSILNAAKTAYAARSAETKIEIGVSGTEGGFTKFCEGALDIAMAYGPISDAQLANCATKQVNFVEVLLGYNAVVFVTNNAAPVTCLAVDQLSKLVGASASGQIPWNAIEPALAATPATPTTPGTPAASVTAVYGPKNDPQLPAIFQISRFLTGGLRSDMQALNTATEIADKLVAEPNSVGIMTLADFQKITGKAIRALQIKRTAADTCIDPTVPNLDEARYVGGESLYLYVNTKSLERKAVGDFLAYLLSADGRKAVTDTSYVQASATLYDRGLGYLNTKRVGRTFSRAQAVIFGAETTGAVNIAGSPSLHPLLTQINSTFTPRFSKITVNLNTFGNEAGYRKLCRNEVDLVGATRLRTQEEAAACQSASVETIEFKVGGEGVVIVVNADNQFATCLKLDSIAKLFTNDYQPKKWSEISDAYPDLDLLVITPKAGAPETDFLLSKTIKDKLAPIRRIEVTESEDSLYRAAGVQNVPGGVTFMTWTEFKKTTAKVKTVAVDAGNGCITPGDTTINDGTYLFSLPLYLSINTRSFSRPEVRAYVWYLLSDDTLTVINQEGVTGVSLEEFTKIRDLVLTRYTQLEATAQPTGEATAAPTTAPTAEPTSQPTVQPTTAATPVATMAPTAEPTSQPTTQPTAESTPDR